MSISNRSGICLAFIMAVLSAACANAQNAVELNGERLAVDLALTREEQARGLMFVEAMPDDHGMLFVFGSEAPRSFWMKNTKIPLDIFYFDSDFTLVSVVRNARPCAVQRCPGYASEGPAQYVLELNAGLADRLGVEQGDELILLFDL